MNNNPRILFLYSELAGYFLACVNELSKLYNANILIIHWQINPEAPFVFEKNTQINYIDKSNLSNIELTNLVREFHPQLIYCSGWIDKEYLKICALYKKKIPVIAGLDTHWSGSFKQHIISLFSRLTVKNYFSHLWIAGKPQELYAKKLGYKNENVLRGVYSADTDYFNRIYQNSKIIKQSEMPRRFIFVGRYLEFKGIFDLWNAFIETFKVQTHNWELWCLGTGDKFESRTQHPSIKHFGFIQPNRIHEFMNQTAVFILPSRFEPWAVAVHEFATAGFPLICSNNVGAASLFLEEGKNGYFFESKNVRQLKDLMLHFINMSNIELLQMSAHSHQLGMKLTPAIWCRQLINLF